MHPNKWQWQVMNSVSWNHLTPAVRRHLCNHRLGRGNEAWPLFKQQYESNCSFTSPDSHITLHHQKNTSTRLSNLVLPTISTIRFKIQVHTWAEGPEVHMEESALAADPWDYRCIMNEPVNSTDCTSKETVSNIWWDLRDPPVLRSSLNEPNESADPLKARLEKHFYHLF